jgi:hypothetical protein
VHFLRDKEGHEVDLVIETAPKILQAVAIKSGATVAGDFFTGLDYWGSKLAGQSLIPWLVYGGESPQKRSKGTVLPWSGIDPLRTALAS